MSTRQLSSTETVRAAVDSLQHLVEPDGARVDLLGIHPDTGAITLALDLTRVPCADCVIDPDRLQQLFEDRVRESVGRTVPVVVVDPRVLTFRSDGDSVDVLDPSGDIPRPIAREVNRDAGSAGEGRGGPVESLVGRVVGFRLDPYWISWNYVAEEWATSLKQEGARIIWWRHRPPVGEQRESLVTELNNFVDELEFGVFGMCNCGACTMWTVEEAIVARVAGRPSVVIATENFASLAKTLAGRDGHGDIPLLILPFPLEGLPESEVRRIAREHYQGLRTVLTGPVPV